MVAEGAAMDWTMKAWIPGQAGYDAPFVTPDLIRFHFGREGGLRDWR